VSQKIHISKVELKTPDRFLLLLNKVSNWFLDHIKAVVALVLVALFLGAAVAVYGTVKSQTEEKLQVKYYAAEKKYLDLKKKFDEGAVQAEAASKNKDKKSATPALPAVIASGDAEKDYSESIAEFKALVEASPSSKAGIMSAMVVADIYRQANKPEQALAVVDKITGNKPKDLLLALAYKLKGNLQADLGQCEQAIGTWKTVVDTKSFGFLSQDLKIKMGLCYEEQKDLANAEKMFKEASTSTAEGASNSSFTKEAEKYLRLLKLKKAASGT
jgi:predicted negative regulator of RcsB-dependent stress response